MSSSATNNQTSAKAAGSPRKVKPKLEHERSKLERRETIGCATNTSTASRATWVPVYN